MIAAWLSVRLAATDSSLDPTSNSTRRVRILRSTLRAPPRGVDGGAGDGAGPSDSDSLSRGRPRRSPTPADAGHQSTMPRRHFNTTRRQAAMGRQGHEAHDERQVHFNESTPHGAASTRGAAEGAPLINQLASPVTAGSRKGEGDYQENVRLLVRGWSKWMSTPGESKWEKIWYLEGSQGLHLPRRNPR
jgi:hypothetical protein